MGTVPFLSGDKGTKMAQAITITSMNRRICRLALPNILSNITIPFLGMVDLALTGHLDDTSAIGAIAISTTLFSLIYWSFAFLRMGTTGLTAQALGAGNGRAQGQILSQSLLIGFLAGVVILLVQRPLRDLALLALGPDISLVPYIHTYFGIVVWGAPAMLCTYALNGWLIGMQNAWWPMVVSIVTNVTNIAVSTSLVLWGDMGIAGVAMGTLIAQWIGVLLLLGGVYTFFLRYGEITLAHSIIELRIGFRRYFGTNVHILLRTLLLAIVSAFFTYAGTQMGPLPLAANALLYQFFNFFSYFIDGFAYAAEAIVGHSYGRKNRKSLFRAVRLVTAWGFGLAVAVSAVYMIVGSSFLHLLSDQPDVLAYAHEYLWWVYLLPLTGFVAFLMDGIFVGLTATREMLWSMLTAVIVFFGLYYGIPTEHPNDALWLAFVSYLLVRGIAQLVLLRRIRGVGAPFTHTYFLSVGSTMNGWEEHIARVLEEHFPAGKLSSFTHSKDATGRTDTVYTNAVLRIEWEGTTEELIVLTKGIEAKMDRDRTLPSEVTLDLDVVVRDKEVLRPKDYGRAYFSRGYEEIGGTKLSV